RPEPPRHVRQNVVIEGRRLVLLRDAALGVAPGELRRIDVVPDLDVASGDAAIPGPDAASRDGDEPVGLEAERRLHPGEKRNPVERLEADLRVPRSRDDEAVARDERLDFALDVPFGAVELHVLGKLAPAPPHAAVRAPSRAQSILAHVDSGIAQPFRRLADGMHRVLHRLETGFRGPPRARGETPHSLAGDVPQRRIRETHRVSTSEASGRPNARRTASTERVSSSTNAAQRSPANTRLATSRWSNRKPVG